VGEGEKRAENARQEAGAAFHEFLLPRIGDSMGFTMT
jgi:hypothetical protein